MRRDTLSLARALSTPATTRRSWLVAAFTLAERLLTPAAAWIVLGHSLTSTVSIAVALGTIFAVRSFVQRTFAARTEADLFVRVADALLRTDVLRANVLADEDARLELGQAIYHATQTLSRDVPALGADAAASVLLACVVLAVEPARIVAIALALTLVGLAALLVSRRSLQKAIEKAWKAQERVYAGFVDALEGRLEIVASGRRTEFMADMAERGRVWSTESMRAAVASVISGRLPLVAIVAVVAAVVLMAGSAWRASLSVSLVDVAFLASVTPAFAGIAQGAQALARSRRWVEMVARIVAAPRITHSGTRLPPTPLTRMAFERVSFCYEADISAGDVLKDVSFELDSTVVAFAGPNGSGKSTCLRLLLGLAEPRSGRITVEGIPLGEMAMETWRARAAFLPQRPYLPPRSDLRSAIRLLAPDASDAVMLQALDRVGLLVSLRRAGPSPLSLGVDTLSVGQRQRVGLARLLCREAAVYLLDEPDANLDRDGIALVAEIVRELARDRVVVLAAHTPELLSLAGRVVLLVEGRVVSPPTGADSVA